MGYQFSPDDLLRKFVEENPRFADEQKEAQTELGAPVITPEIISWLKHQLASAAGLVRDRVEPGSPRANIRPMGTNLIDAKIAASEARTDAKFAELRGDMRAGFADIRTEVQGLVGKLDLVVNQTAQSDRQIADLRSDVRGIRDEVRSENHSTRTTFIVTAVATFLAIAGALIGLLQYGDGRFGLARSVSELTQEAAKAQATRDEAQDATIQSINAKFDQILQRLPPPSAPTNTP